MGEGAYCRTWMRVCVSSLWLSAPIFSGSRMARGRMIRCPRLHTVFPGLSLRIFEIHRVPKVTKDCVGATVLEDFECDGYLEAGGEGPVRLPLAN